MRLKSDAVALDNDSSYSEYSDSTTDSDDIATNDRNYVKKKVMKRFKRKLSKMCGNIRPRKGMAERAYYVLNLCDKLLKQTASRQHRFKFLQGDLHKDGVTRTPIPAVMRRC